MEIKYSIRHYPPQIKSIKFDCYTRTLALPPLSIIYNHPYRSINCWMNVRGNIYQHPPIFRGKTVPENRPPFEYFWDSGPELINGFYFKVNENLTIKSLQQWHDLTQQNPNFVQEQFERQTRGNSNSYIDQYRNIHIPAWLLPESKRCKASFNKQPPKNRSVLVMQAPFFLPRSTRPTPGQFMTLSFPEITLVSFRPKGGGQMTLCLARCQYDRYIPFNLPDVDPFGIACMGINYNILEHDPFDYFWNSSFHMIANPPIQVNENLSIDSLQQWRDLTQQNPNFFQQQFDPVHSGQYSPIIYTIEETSPNNCLLSWEFNQR